MGGAPSTSQVKMHRYRRPKHEDNSSRLSKNNLFIREQQSIDDQDLQIIKIIMHEHCLFSHVPLKLRDFWLNKFSKWRFSSGYYIYKQNDVSSSLYLIKDGGVYYEVYCDVVKTLSERQYFGHDTLCFDSPRNESIRVASKEIVVYQLKKEHIFTLFQTYMRNYRQEIDSSFSRIHFFNYLNNKEKEVIVENTFLFRLKINDSLFEKEQNANSFYIIKKGTIKIQISNKKDIIMQEEDYFGESAFFTLTNNSAKNQRMGRAAANSEEVELYAVGLTRVKESLGSEIRSIMFFNQEKWALYRDPYLSSLKSFDCNYLLQLFNVKECKKYTVLARKLTKPEYLFIPLEVEINTSKDLKLYGSQFLNEQNKEKVLSEDIILTDNGYYAYALLSEFREVLALHKQSQHLKDVEAKLYKQPIFKILTLTLRNINQCSKKIDSSDYSTVLIAQDMKFGSEFVIKIYKKKTSDLVQSLKETSSGEIGGRKALKLKSRKTFGGNETRTSLKTILPMRTSRRLESSGSGSVNSKQEVDERIVVRQKTIISSLNSKFICGYYKAQQDQKHYYLFLEYIVGQTLDELIVQFGVVPQSVIKYIIASIAAALDYLHKRRVIYRNLNPSNITIKNSGFIVMTDFSCAKELGENIRTSTVTGVPYYMAPEVIQKKDYTFNADVWSMGVVLYEMMSGCLPFGEQATEVMEIYQSILNDELNLRKIRNKSERALVEALLKKDSDERLSNTLLIRKFSYINDVEFDWQALLSNKMKPFYFPIKKTLNYTYFKNFQLFDGSKVEDWI